MAWLASIIELMPTVGETLQRLSAIPNVAVSERVPLAPYTRFGIGGPADLFVEAASESGLVAAMSVVRDSGLPAVVIGDGSNLVVSDAGFRGAVLRYRGAAVSVDGRRITAQSGAFLQTLVDASVANGLGGIETLAGIPGSVGAAVYGNAGAYGRSIGQWVSEVRAYDGREALALGNRQCEFAYRESVFKRRKDWLILSVCLVLDSGDGEALRRRARDIVTTRDEKFPPSMKCAGSVFKNLLLRDLPASVVAQVPATVVREGKIPAAWFLEQVGAKAAARGDIHVAAYHANLIYNAGAGSAADFAALVADLKARVLARFGFALEEEVQYLG
jgi:UDP-N-acetylmuramate dehydrogenase